MALGQGQHTLWGNSFSVAAVRAGLLARERSTHKAPAHKGHNPAKTAHANKLTWLVLGEDPAARSHRVEQFTAL